MTNRVVLGARGNGTFGLWVSKPGFDARTATESQLLLGITQYTEQLIMLGSTSSLPAFVPFGFVTAPFVLLTSTNLSLTIVTGTTNGGKDSSTTSVSGLFARPYPNCGNSGAAVQAAVTNLGMTISCPAGGTTVATYAVYRRSVR